MHLTFKNPSNPFQIVNIGKISDSYSISFVTSTTLDNYIVPAQFLDGHLDQDYFGYSFLKGFVRGFTSSQIPPTVNTDNKTVATGEQVGVVDSVGDALFPFVAQTDNFQPLNNLVLDVDGRKYSLTIPDLRTIGNALQIYHNHNSQTDWGWNDETNEKEIKLKHISDLRDQFRNIQNYYSVEHQAWIKACENGSIFAESGIFDKAE